jgi:hypothetical protein
MKDSSDEQLVKIASGAGMESEKLAIYMMRRHVISADASITHGCTVLYYPWV